MKNHNGRPDSAKVAKRGAYVLAALGLFVFNLWAIWKGYLRALADEAIEVSSVQYLIWWAPTILFLTGALLAAWLGFRNRVAAVLAGALFLIGATNFISDPAWSNSDSLKHGIANLGWLALLTAVLIFPKGQFRPKLFAPMIFILSAFYLAGNWLAHNPDAAASFKPLKDYQELAIPALFALCAAAIVYRMRSLTTTLDRQKTDWIFSGIFGAAALLLAPHVGNLFTKQIEETHIVRQTWAQLQGPIEASAFALFGFGLIVAIGAAKLPYGRRLLNISASASILLFVITIAFLLLETLIGNLAENVFEGATLVAKLVMSLIGLYFLKPLKKYLDTQTRKLVGPRASNPPPHDDGDGPAEAAA